MTLKLTNTLTRKKEEFTPIHTGKVGLYACGPTVYGYPSIGNYRTFLFTDLLRRSLEFLGYEVRHVMNITDVGHLTGDSDDGEDKMITAMKREGKSAWDIAEYYTKVFLADMDALHMLRPHQLPKATEHIEEQIAFIQEIEKQGFAYVISDGVYFDTSQLADYGKLSGQALEEKEEGARVAVNPEKRNATDFALWKFSTTDEDRLMEWESPWGKGFPGWHIECSAMSEKYLDMPFDIHTGGADLAPVHHTNEIAQCQGAHGHDPVHVWMHGEFLQIDGGKMSKSLGNVYTIQDLQEKSIEPLAYRYFILNAHYRSTLNFTWESVQAAQNALHRLRVLVRDWDQATQPDEASVEAFRACLEDDINMPKALALMWEVVNSDMESGIKSATLLQFDRVFGLGLKAYIATPLQITDEVQALLDERKQARDQKNWEMSDQLRDRIAELGFVVEDKPDGQKVREA